MDNGPTEQVLAVPETISALTAMPTDTYALRLADGIGYLNREEVQMLYRIAYLLPPNAFCCNIGAGAGTSIIAILEMRPDLGMVSVDLNGENAMSQLIEAGMLPRILKIIGDSKQIMWNYGPLDYLFVDGDHSKEGIEGDIAAWLPRMKYGSLILFDDYGCPTWPDVKPVVDYYVANYGWELIERVNELAAFRIPIP